MSTSLILRKCNSDGSSSFGFKYGNQGDTVTAPDWNPEPMCGNGLHGLRNANGEWGLLDGDDWLVIEVNDEDIVDIGKNKCKFRTGKILYRGDKEGLHQYADRMATSSHSAYWWAMEIGDREKMRDRITESEHAFLWAVEIGDKEIMRDRVADSRWAYHWAKDIGDKEIMIDLVTDSEYAFHWARNIGDKEIMKPKVTEPYSVGRWNEVFPDSQIS